jgi:hypothetical protein
MTHSTPADWPYKIRVRINNTHQTHFELFRSYTKWCEAKFGRSWDVRRDGRWCYFWCGPRDHEYYKFHFRNQEDAVMFALRWS